MGSYAAMRSPAFVSTGLKPGNQSRNESAKVPFKTLLRTARNGPTIPAHLLRLTHRLAMISLIADSTQAVEIGSPS